MPSWCRQTVARASPGRLESGSGNRPIGDDEELLSGADEAKLTAGQLFDGRGVVTQAIGLKRELSVLPPEPRDRLGELQILAPHPGGLDESPLAGNPVGEKDGGCQNEQEPCHVAA